MKNTLISILMPVKNTAQFLPTCIDSILSQTATNFELLAVNDHSTDKSLAILKSYERFDKRVKVYQNKGEGIISALQLAFTESKGNFITRMDSDDIMSSNKLKIMKDLLLNNGEGNIALGLVKYIAKNGVGEGFKKYEHWLNSLILKGNNFDEIYKECVIPSPCWMLYKSDLVKTGAFNSAVYPEDYDLAFRFYQHKLNCLPSNQLLHYWRDYPTRTSRTSLHYADNTFINIKTAYFLKLDYQKDRPLVVWGAGKKGKSVARLLIKNNIKFCWICDNPKKIGKEIYKQQLLSFNYLDEVKNAQSIITVANTKAQNEIKNYLTARGKVMMRDCFFFC